MDDTVTQQLRDAGMASADISRLDALPADAQAVLAERLMAAQRSQSDALAAAMDGMLGALPRMLRGPVGKLFQ